MSLPTKTLRFDKTVIDLLRGMQWSQDGLQAVITVRLDPKTYKSVNSALEAMGGKWNRKAQAHVFEEDPRGKVEGLIESGAVTVVKDGFFPTPAPVIARMLDYARLFEGATVLEPSAGSGAIVDYVLTIGPRGLVFNMIEINEKRARALADRFNGTPHMVMCADFMDLAPFVHVDRVLMNPPFENGAEMDHVQHAYKFLKPGGVLVSVMSKGPFFRNDRKAESFREWA